MILFSFVVFKIQVIWNIISNKLSSLKVSNTFKQKHMYLTNVNTRQRVLWMETLGLQSQGLEQF